ncbi:hypothetical protein KI387_010280, partial [Taxus chinensis]
MRDESTRTGRIGRNESRQPETVRDVWDESTRTGRIGRNESRQPETVQDVRDE